MSKTKAWKAVLEGFPHGLVIVPAPTVAEARETADRVLTEVPTLAVEYAAWVSAGRPMKPGVVPADFPAPEKD